ncbi:cisplatin damage response ATP-dependent DNA ligase [Rhodoligotrophos defluvii]|uniref:cisplatin damage response ATP-dependent DNA ligase n=1 Tax=Rhodoligotrophos defluvii TaxID=2561934 RepID=UPI0010C938E8|nr:cisplatin damage response ATP-dependent DNA ligase [Rhodoligotrophos defluvii]
MRAFSNLLNRLAFTPSRNGKLALLVAYLRETPDPDRGWAVAALTDGLFFRLPVRRLVTELIEPRVDPVLYGLSRDYVGDTAETVALIWPEPPKSHIARLPPPRLAEVVDAIASAHKSELTDLVAGWLDRLDAEGRWALLKLLTGALRVGVSARLAKTAIATYGGVEPADIEEVWHGISPPYVDLFAWLDAKGERPDPGAKPIFRPLMLAHPIEEGDWPNLKPEDYLAEWKWDGIRVQVAAKGDEVRLYSRAGDEISGSFPEVAIAFRGRHVVLDGELLVMRGGEIAPFNDLQQRLNRKTVTPSMITDYPAHVRLYDMLMEGDDDLRPLPLLERRQRLEEWHGLARVPRTDVSQLIAFDSFEALNRLWESSRENGIEGLMLKRRDSAYLAGRPKGYWWKWKRSPLTLDLVLMYAQRGSGKRSSYYSDYTFGAWRQRENGEDELVPVGKAYSGYTDEELLRLDRWIRNNTVDRFGPVRAVKPGIVLEVAFDSVHSSTRHKSGVAMRFPRIHRIRWDKPAEEADRLEALEKLIDGQGRA